MLDYITQSLTFDGKITNPIYFYFLMSLPFFLSSAIINFFRNLLEGKQALLRMLSGTAAIFLFVSYLSPYMKNHFGISNSEFGMGLFYTTILYSVSVLVMVFISNSNSEVKFRPFSTYVIGPCGLLFWSIIGFFMVEKSNALYWINKHMGSLRQDHYAYSMPKWYYYLIHFIAYVFCYSTITDHEKARVAFRELAFDYEDTIGRASSEEEAMKLFIKKKQQETSVILKEANVAIKELVELKAKMDKENNNSED